MGALGTRTLQGADAVRSAAEIPDAFILVGWWVLFKG